MIDAIDRALLGRLDRAGIDHCLIGAVALAMHGVARYTADIDLLTTDPRVLDPALWADLPAADVRARVDPTDPVPGVVRLGGEVPHDVVLLFDHAARTALAGATAMPGAPCKVATPLGMVLLKLEAGGPQDRYDILSLIDARRALDAAPWLGEIETHLPRLSPDARAIWTELKPLIKA